MSTLGVSRGPSRDEQAFLESMIVLVGSIFLAGSIWGRLLGPTGYDPYSW